MNDKDPTTQLPGYNELGIHHLENIPTSIDPSQQSEVKYLTVNGGPVISVEAARAQRIAAATESVNAVYLEQSTSQHDVAVSPVEQ